MKIRGWVIRLVAIVCVYCLIMPKQQVLAQDLGYKKIENNSMLTEKQASDISDFVCDKINKQYAGSYKMENYHIVFSDKEVNDEDNLWVKMDVIFDMTLVENPEDSAYVKGMAAEVQRMVSSENGAAAQRAYDKLVKELMMNYKQTQTTFVAYLMSIPRQTQEAFSVDDVALFYRGEFDDSETELCPVTIDEGVTAVLDEEDGREALRNAMQNMTDPFEEPTYDRTAAAAYAVAHATEPPEFSADNNMGTYYWRARKNRSHYSRSICTP